MGDGRLFENMGENGYVYIDKDTRNARNGVGYNQAKLVYA